MSYLKFDKLLLTNLQKSLDKEMLRTNRAGAYSSTTIVDCNTRKYHGLFVVPVPKLGIDNHVLLSSLDETIIQHGAEFNLGIHKYRDEHYSPKGHKYIREFHIDSVATTVYRVGGVVLQKERIFESGENRMLISYTLLEAHSPTTLRLRPLLAFRSVHELMHETDSINAEYKKVVNGTSFRLFDDYPELVMQTNKASEFVDQPSWYKGIEYYKEQERGYEYKEDLYVPGYFELQIKKGETIIFSAGLDEIMPDVLLKHFDYECEKRTPRIDFKHTLKTAAEQFYNKRKDGLYLLAGYPWFKYRARDEFIALPGVTLSVGNIDTFEDMMEVGCRAIRDFLMPQPKTTLLKEVSAPDVLLWFIWDIQMYAHYTSLKRAVAKYGDLVLEVMEFIRKQKHSNLFLHDNGLLFTNGQQKPATWMNAMEDNLPITPRSGYVVEINALWYNALCFATQIAAFNKDAHLTDRLTYQSGLTKVSFLEQFWNGTYLYDYVNGDVKDKEVRPNMLLAVALEHSPLDKKAKKSTLDIITRELLTPKGLRSLSPKSGMYCPNYVGNMKERTHNYHNGPVWPWTTAFYVDAYLSIYKMSGLGMVQRLLSGFENDLTQLTVGTLSELYDGNPPFRGHGAMSYAPTIAAVIRAAQKMTDFEYQYQQQFAK